MPRFHVRETFPIQDRTTFVLAGFVVEGEVKAGMAVSIPFNANVKLTAKIDRIEFVHRPDGDVVCLCLGCAVPDEITLWDALNIKNRIIDVTDLS
jgi:hypothetical protein